MAFSHGHLIAGGHCKYWLNWASCAMIGPQFVECHARRTCYPAGRPCYGAVVTANGPMTIDIEDPEDHSSALLIGDGLPGMRERSFVTYAQWLIADQTFFFFFSNPFVASTEYYTTLVATPWLTVNSTLMPYLAGAISLTRSLSPLLPRNSDVGPRQVPTVQPSIAKARHIPACSTSGKMTNSWIVSCRETDAFPDLVDSTVPAITTAFSVCCVYHTNFSMTDVISRRLS